MALRNTKDDETELREAGQRLTPQRRLILEVMRNLHGHVSVEDVMQEATRHDSSVSLATVYRILSWLTDHEIVCVTDMGGRDLAYEYLGHPRHHHLVCQQCGGQEEVPFEVMEPVIQQLRQSFGFEARIDHQAIFGTCRDCRPDS